MKVVQTFLPGELRHRRVRLATLGLAILVAAASFGVLTASADAISVHALKTLQTVHGARSRSIHSRKQKVHCSSGMGSFRREYACKTKMRLVCRRSPGRTILRRIPNSAYYANVWHVDFSPYHRWGTNGPPVKGGRLSIHTPRGARREEAIVTLPRGGTTGTQVIIRAGCS